MKCRNNSGFTLVEVLIVVIVIAILAAITIVAYNGVTARARDSARKSDLQQVAGALQLYNNKNGNFIESGSGCGMYGNGNGWLSTGPSDLSSYPRSIISCLQDGGYINEGQFIDPTGCKSDLNSGCGSWNGKPVTAYMKATCLTSGVKTTYLFARTEAENANSAATIDALCDAGSVNGFTTDGQKWGTHYGMNYYVKLNS